MMDTWMPKDSGSCYGVSEIFIWPSQEAFAGSDSYACISAQIELY